MKYRSLLRHLREEISVKQAASSPDAAICLLFAEGFARTKNSVKLPA
jgi:hypothetical protein